MRMICTTLCMAVLAVSTTIASAAGIRGDYIEARTADVFTGPCFSNAEVFIYGNHAERIMRRGGRGWNDHVLARSAGEGHLDRDRRQPGVRTPA